MTVIAHHLIWTAYGWWLPNDPRGGMSRTIREDIIGSLGELHYGRKRVQPASHDIREFYSHAAEVLKHALLDFTESERSALARVFADVARQERYTCYACAIMPDHVHMVVRKHRALAEDMILQFQSLSCSRFRAEGLRDLDHPVWGGPGWKVFLDDPEDVWRTIPYVEDNPVKIRLPAQRWSFVVPYDNWLHHKRAAVQHSASARNRKRIRTGPVIRLRFRAEESQARLTRRHARSLVLVAACVRAGIDHRNGLVRVD